MENPIDATNSAINDDFLDAGKVHVMNNGASTGKYQARLPKDEINILDTQAPGTLIHIIPLNPTFDDGAAANSKKYLYYKMKNVVVDYQAVSPFGTSSGSIQVCYVPDPQNVIFPQDTAGSLQTSILKAIREENSVQIRPRDSVKLSVEVPDRQLYCLSGTDSRLSSYGAIVAVVREAPSAGDAAAFAVTATADFEFFFASISDGATGLQTTTLKTLEMPRTASMIANTINMELDLKGEPVSTGMLFFRDPCRITCKVPMRRGLFYPYIGTFSKCSLDFLGQNEDGTNRYHATFVEEKPKGITFPDTELDEFDINIKSTKNTAYFNAVLPSFDVTIEHLRFQAARNARNK